MSKIECKQIAYYGKPIDSLTRDELISALEELAGAIHDCAVANKKLLKDCIKQSGNETLDEAEVATYILKELGIGYEKPIG